MPALTWAINRTEFPQVQKVLGRKSKLGLRSVIANSCRKRMPFIVSVFLACQHILPLHFCSLTRSTWRAPIAQPLHVSHGNSITSQTPPITTPKLNKSVQSHSAFPIFALRVKLVPLYHETNRSGMSHCVILIHFIANKLFNL